MCKNSTDSVLLLYTVIIHPNTHSEPGKTHKFNTRTKKVKSRHAAAHPTPSARNLNSQYSDHRYDTYIKKMIFKNKTFIARQKFLCIRACK